MLRSAVTYVFVVIAVGTTATRTLETLALQYGAGPFLPGRDRKPPVDRLGTDPRTIWSQSKKCTIFRQVPLRNLDYDPAIAINNTSQQPENK